MSEKDGSIKDASSIPEPKSRRKWPIFASAAALLILGLCALWFLCLSSMVGGLAILYKCGFFGTAVLCIAALVAYRKEIVDHPEKPFLVIVLALTCCSSWVYDTNEVTWDMESHFKFMLAYSEPDRIHELTEATKSVETRSLDFSEYDLVSTQILEDAIDDPDGTIDFETIHIFLDTDALQVKDNMLNELDSFEDSDHGEILGPLSRVFIHVSSLPASLIYGFLTLLGIPFVLKFVFAKMIYALIYSFVMYFGMRKLKSGKLIFAVVALYPTGVFLAANYSYDFWVNAFTMYAIASIVGQLQMPDEPMRPKEMVKIVIAFAIGLAPKAIFFPLVLLTFLIPRSKFASRSNMWLFRGGACLAALVLVFSFAAPLLAPSSTLSGDVRGGSDVNAGGQMSYILTHPLAYAQTCFLYILDYLSIPHTQNYIVHAAYLGKGHFIVWVIILALTLFSTVTDTRSDTKLMDRWSVRVFVIAVLLVALVLAVTAIYVSFTAVGLDTVKGFQGRYFLPLLFPLLIFMGTQRTAWPLGKKQRTVVSMSTLLIMLLMNYYFVWDMYVGLLK